MNVSLTSYEEIKHTLKSTRMMKGNWRLQESTLLFFYDISVNYERFLIKKDFSVRFSSFFQTHDLCEYHYTTMPERSAKVGIFP